MLLIPLVENCFKHGASKDVGKITIDMDVQVEENVMLFRLTNTIPPEQIASKVPTRSGGIGLSNIRKRLELGYAAKEYDFNASRAGDKFVVYLRLAV